MADALNLRIGMPIRALGTVSFQTFTLDQSGDQWEVIFAAEESGAITRLGFRLSSITGTSPTFKISLQGVDSSGIPDGTIKGGGSPASATFNPSSLGWTSGSWHWITLDNSYTCARGEMLSMVIAYDSGTIDGSNSITISTTMITTAETFGFPYNIQNNNGTRTRSTIASVWGYGTATKAYGRPVASFGTQVFTSISNPNEAGIKFTIPAGWADTFQVKGLAVLISTSAASSILFQLYDGGGASDLTVLQDWTLDTDDRATSGTVLLYLPFDEVTLSSLVAGNSYRATFAPQSAVAQTPTILTVDSADDWAPYMGGSNFQWTTRNGGNWTDDPARRPFIDLVLADITEPSGGGGTAGARLVGPSALVSC